MSEVVFRRDSCRLCGGTDRELVLPLEPTPIGEAYVPSSRLIEPQACYPMDLFLCRTCGHAEFADVINPEVLYGNYIYQTSILLWLVEHFRSYPEEVVRQVTPAPNAQEIDIGSNDGSLLSSFKDLGLKVLGVDPAREIARKATDSGVETIADFFTTKLARKILEKNGPAAIVTANNVFANIDNLADVAAGVRELLAPNGVFVFETSYLLDVLQKVLLETFFHEHLCYFSVRPLEMFFRRHGMELFEVKRVPTKGGSIADSFNWPAGRERLRPRFPSNQPLKQDLD